MAALSRIPSIMPLSRPGREAHHGGMGIAQTAPTLLLIDDPRHPGGLVPRPWRTGDRVVARLLAPSLDRRVSAGGAPDSDRWVPTGAGMLVAPRWRRTLAAHWEHLLEEARRPPVRLRRGVPLCR